MITGFLKKLAVVFVLISIVFSSCKKTNNGTPQPGQIKTVTYYSNDTTNLSPIRHVTYAYNTQGEPVSEQSYNSANVADGFITYSFNNDTLTRQWYDSAGAKTVTERALTDGHDHIIYFSEQYMYTNNYLTGYIDLYGHDEPSANTYTNGNLISTNTYYEVATCTYYTNKPEYRNYGFAYLADATAPEASYVLAWFFGNNNKNLVASRIVTAENAIFPSAPDTTYFNYQFDTQGRVNKEIRSNPQGVIWVAGFTYFN